MKSKTFLLASLLLIASCDSFDQNKANKVLGPVKSAPYELLIVCDKQWYKSEAGDKFRELVNTLIPGMPQDEPEFKVVCINAGAFTKTFSTFGCIIFVNTGTKYKQKQYITARDMFATPQMIITLNAPDFAGIDTLVDERGEQILQLMKDNEIKRTMAALKKKHSSIVQNEAKDRFKVKAWHMPPEITLIKKGEKFFWASSPDNTYNACMYSYPWVSNNTFTKDYFINKRDSVMHLYIEGEEWGQHMTTNKSTVTVKERMIDGHYVMEVRGLWEMKGDAMGGPFISYVQLDSASNNIIVTEGFAYLPNKEKKKILHPLEAGLRTLKMRHVD